MPEPSNEETRTFADLQHPFTPDEAGHCVFPLDARVARRAAPGDPPLRCGMTDPDVPIHQRPDSNAATTPHQLRAIELTFTPTTGRINLSCAVHAWWGRDQIEPNGAALQQAVAIHAMLEHGGETP
jgi:hypothetical protein